jgi:hypothetical protein
MRRVVWTLALALFATTAPSAGGDEPAAGDPPLCRDAIAAHPGDQLDALRRAEEDRWRAARSASRRGKKLMADAVEQGDTGAQRQRAARIGQTSDDYRRALQEARILCGCRERRGDPYREDCERLFFRYRGALQEPPAEPEPEGPKI